MGSIRTIKCKNCGIFLTIKTNDLPLEFGKVYIRKCPKCSHINKVKLMVAEE